MTVRTMQQRELLASPLETSWLLYNAGLEERCGAWRKAGLGTGYHNQCHSLTLLSGDPSLHRLPVSILRWPLTSSAGGSSFRWPRRPGRRGH